MRRISAGILGALLALAAVSCSDDDGGDAAGEGASPATPSAASSGPGSEESGGTPGDAATTPPYLPVPEGVSLTMQGVDLDLGDRATVAWEPRKSVVGALDVRVDRLQRAPITALSAFRLDKVQQTSSLFYVRGRVRNVGDTDLSGVDVPLYVVDGRDTLIQATPFAATFKPCPSGPMPKRFKTGAKASFCLVYLVPQQGRLVSVSFRPTQEYDPITWTGKVEQPKRPKKQG